MNFTSRMAALLGELRRERNGAVADAMGFYGKPYGLNYGVSISTVRQMARAETPDHDFAQYLYLQDVRELRLTALHIALPEKIAISDFPVWAAGIVNSEVAEEAAFALLSRIEPLGELFERWTNSENPLLQYAAMLAASRSQSPSPMWIESALDVVRRNALIGTEPYADAISDGATTSLSVSFPGPTAPNPAFYASDLTARGAVAVLTAIGLQNDENRQAVLRAAGSQGAHPALDFIHEELAWRLNP